MMSSFVGNAVKFLQKNTEQKVIVVCINAQIVENIQQNKGGIKMEKINLNELAKEVARDEGKLEEINISQIKEVIKYTLLELSCYDGYQILEVIERTRKRHQW